MQVAIVDYEAGNLFSVERACKSVGLSPLITSDPKDMLSSDALILPGVGAFGDAMNNLERLKLIQPIIEFIKSGKHFMGICLGMQLLFSESQEFGCHKGLGIIKGCVKRFSLGGEDNIGQAKVPQIGWNHIFRPPSASESYWDTSPLKAVQNGEFMYFVHSFYVIPNSKENLLAVTNYSGIEYASGVMQNNVWGFQFHPEKSGTEGLKIYENFRNIIGRGE